MSHIAIVGAGIVGLASAAALHRQGHQVTVYDAEAGPGQGTSKANGAQLSYSFVTPLASPAVLRSLHHMLLERDGALRFRPRLQAAQWRWLLSFLDACTAQRNAQGADDLLHLGLLSRRTLDELLAREPLAFSHARSGKLQVFDSEAAFHTANRVQTAFLETYGIAQQALDAQETVALEPSLAPIAGRIRGGLFTPSEESGDCEQLCQALHTLLAAQGVRFCFGTPVTALRRNDAGTVRAFSRDVALEGDTIVLASGGGTQALLRPLGLSADIYPLRGYSLTYPVDADCGAPQASVSDIGNKVVYARIGDRLRVAGMMDIGVDATQTGVIRHRLQTLRRQVGEFLPGLRALGEPLEWTGERAARPDSKPIVGASPVANLFFNVGHGALGFTLAFGSAQLLADILAGSADPDLARRFAYPSH